MSRKLDWADQEARKLAKALSLRDEPTAVALIAATLRLAHSRGVSEGIDRVDAALKQRGETSGSGSSS